MNKDLQEMNTDFQNSIVDYTHTGVIAQYFLSKAKKFTMDGRVMEKLGLMAKEYWTIFKINV